MTSDRHQNVEWIFSEALEIDPDQRPAYLEEACAGDESLLSEVESLLAYVSKDGGLIDQPIVETAFRAAPKNESLIGQSIGQYKILSVLGKGGMGEVYLGDDLVLNRKVAIKLLPVEFTNDSARVMRFAQEARAASSLNHPNIITIHGIGEAQTDTGTTHYIVNEYIDGETLRTRMTDAPSKWLSPKEAVEMTVQVAAALAAAHEAGILHRDIKPENVMIRHDGIVKVLDFGLAKLTERASPLSNSSVSTLIGNTTAAGLVMGTPRYMSPEQARAEEVDERTDIFSLGVVLYEMLTGRAPFDGATANEVVAAIMRDPPPPLAENSVSVSPELERILSRALQKKREQRYQSAKALLQDLKEVSEKQAFEARLERSSSWQPKALLALGVVITILAIALVIQLRSSITPKRSSSRGMTIVRLTNGGFIQHAVISPDGKYFAFMEKDGASAQLWLGEVAGGPPRALVRGIEQPIVGLTFAPDSQAVYYVLAGKQNPSGALYRVPASGGPVTQLLSGVASPVAFAPDGKQIAFVRLVGQLDAVEGNSLVVADTTTGNERVVRTHRGVERLGLDGPSWSPDGKQVACALARGGAGKRDDEHRLIDIDVKNGSEVLLSSQVWDGIGRISWLRDGTGIVLVGTKSGEVVTPSRDAMWFVSQPDGAIRRITNDLNRHYYDSVSASDDGQSLLIIPYNRTSQIWSVTARAQNTVRLYDARTAVQLTTGTAEGRAGITTLADGRIIYVARTGESVALWQIRNDRSEQRQLTNTPAFLEEVSAPPDASYLVFSSNHAGLNHLFRVNADGTNLHQLTAGDSRESDSDCSPDGRWVVYASKSSSTDKISHFKLWKIPAEGGEPIPLTDHEAQSPHFSPDGNWISYVYWGESGWRMTLIRSDDGKPVKSFDVPGSASMNIGARWTPDSKGLVYIANGKTFDNLWVQPMNGDAPYALTDFTSGEIFNFAFSRNGHQLFLARGYSIRDVSLIKHFR